ncbi:hypothetical protein TNCV_2886191 [Trichonephila clavipes]|nr:hypothetical protein TNCV_2886191 [Trichonephila clavipes]
MVGRNQSATTQDVCSHLLSSVGSSVRRQTKRNRFHERRLRARQHRATYLTWCQRHGYRTDKLHMILFSDET